MDEKKLRKVLREELSRTQVPKVFDTKETAKILGISPGTLQNYRVDGRGPRFCRIGGAIRYQLAEINLWLQSQTVIKYLI